MTAKILSILPALKAKMLAKREEACKEFADSVESAVLPFPKSNIITEEMILKLVDRQRLIEIAYAQKELEVLQEQKAELETMLSNMAYTDPINEHATAMVSLIWKMKKIMLYIKQKEEGN